MKKRYIILLALLVLIIAGAGIRSYLERNLEQLVDLPISDVNLKEVKDGTYTGSYKRFPVEAEVLVTISDHRITEIKILKHDNGQGAPAEAIPGKVMEAQSLKVDSVSGATYSSTVILKAIESALNSNSK